MALAHVRVVHENCKIPRCPICDGGLFCCSVCGGGEGALTTECPGVKLSFEELRAIQNGKKDYVSGRWQPLTSPHSPRSKQRRF